jgi:formylglycine-generating enzyme required for sulfatase activity
MDASTRGRPAPRLLAEMRQARAHTDALFGLVAEETLYERPIADRHRLVFYVGHLDAFDWNQLGRGVLGLPSFRPSFDRLFEAGIDPPPGQAPADAPADWPALDDVRAYVARTRRELDERWPALPPERVLTALEHRWMHAETLCYLLHQLDPSKKRRPSSLPPVEASGATPLRNGGAWVDVPAGTAALGQQPGEFGWDNEFPRHRVGGAGFEVSRYKLTNGEYLRFVEAGGPASHFWRRRGDRWWLRRMFDEVPLPLDAPVYVTQRQAEACAAWAGARLPTEAEWQRAAYGDGERRYPWGDQEPDAARANLGFVGWDPSAVTAQPLGATPQGVEQMLGNGWEWTASAFAPFDGFAPRPYYPGYSANFFDGAHYVMKGASPRTARRLARPSFRNWFRADYPYVFATVRLVRGRG